MRNLPLLITLILVACARNSVPPPAPREENESIVFPKTLSSGGLLSARPDQTYDIDGVAVQAITIAAHDFISSNSKGLPCWNKMEDFLFRVIRQGNITFVSIDANPFACERYGMLDFGAQYAISTDGRILRRLAANEPDWTSPPSSPDAGANEDAGYSQKYDLKELDRMNMGPVSEPPFFTRPEWLDSENNPWRSLRRPHPPSVPDGGTPDGGTSGDGGSPAALPE